MEKQTEHSTNSHFMKYPYRGTPTTHQGVNGAGIDHIIVPSNSLNFSTIEQYGGVFCSYLKRSLNLCQIAQCTLLEPGKLGMQSEELMCMGAQSKKPDRSRHRRISCSLAAPSGRAVHYKSIEFGKQAQLELRRSSFFLLAAREHKKNIFCKIKK